DGMGLIKIFRQLSGIEVCEVVDLLMVHGINALFLLRRQLVGGIHLGLIAGGGGAGLVVTVAVEVVGPPGRLLADGIILRHPATPERSPRSGAPVLGAAGPRSASARAWASFICWEMDAGLSLASLRAF